MVYNKYLLPDRSLGVREGKEMTQSSQSKVDQIFAGGASMDGAMKLRTSGPPAEVPRVPELRGRSGSVVREYDRDPVIVQLPRKEPSWLEISRRHLAEVLPSPTPQYRP